MILLPQAARDFDALYRCKRDEFDAFARKMAAERRENYRTKGTYC